jgi:hypothetical protein
VRPGAVSNRIVTDKRGLGRPKRTPNYRPAGNTLRSVISLPVFKFDGYDKRQLDEFLKSKPYDDENK